MKKIAFMFAVAAGFAACGNNAEVALTADDSAKIEAQAKDSLQKLADAVVVDYSKAANADDSLAAEKAAEDQKAAILADTVLVKALYEQALQAKKDSAEGKTEQPAEEKK